MLALSGQNAAEDAFAAEILRGDVGRGGVTGVHR
jgi:hypothetical protein